MREDIKQADTATTLVKCDYIKLPFLIVTQNLIIRPLIKQDKKEMMEAIRDSLSNLQMWLPWSDKRPPTNEFVTICQNFYSEMEENLAYHFVVYQNDKFMGMCSLMNVDLKSRSARLGYWCRQNSDNQDYFIEAINGLLRYALESSTLKEIYIECIVGNYLSELTAKELHFKLQSVDLIHNKQIKLYKFDNLQSLPELQTYSVVN